jgi:hypothetical protein
MVSCDTAAATSSGTASSRPGGMQDGAPRKASAILQRSSPNSITRGGCAAQFSSYEMPAKIPGVNLPSSAPPIMLSIPPHELVLASCLFCLQVPDHYHSPVLHYAQSTGAGSLSRALLSPGSQIPASFSRSQLRPLLPSICSSRFRSTYSPMNLRQAMQQRRVML